ncbi:MAG: bifunctional 4-hydroxy-3-methylbut-2-enyl diphosphate reductase/30S ribosomal protein S1 [Lachnospiraceae bacterium]|nr:bifunctional 4-hydroxy-3-methylbut-2-enyl diphosphate reductase/30S ribosomal protein S1 [Lachnospiraceae bacterium]
MKITVSAKAGFCFGVRRSCELTQQAHQTYGRIYTLGPIIHNPQLVSRLEAEGIIPVEDLSSLRDCVVVLRSHGESPDRIERLAGAGCRIVDTTCPCVKRIHTIAKEAAVPFILIGEKNHPEVTASIDWANGPAFVVDSEEDISQLPEMEEAAVAAQTTCVRTHFEEMVSLLRQRIPRMELYDTICASTQQRLAEAEALADVSDRMIVVGGKNSSNTKKLFQACAQRCANTLHVETAQELGEILKGVSIGENESIGITAGASTPDEIIEEVVTLMSEMDKNIIPQTEPVEEEKQEAEGADSNFLTEFEKTVKSIRPGQTVVGTVVQVTEDEVCVNIGYKADGLVPRDQLIDPKETYNVGDEIEVEIVKVNDGEGNVLLSQKNIVARKVWDDIMAKYENGEFIKAVGSAVVKGGLIANLDGVRIFVPASQIAERYIEKLDQFIGKELTLKIIEVDKSKKRLVASRKQAMIEENKRLKEAVWERLKVGEVVHGIVRRITVFGAFVDLGGVDGLIHITDLSWGHIDHPSSVVKPGDEVDVLVLNLDPERERISLGLKQLKPKPWETAQVNYPTGSIVEGKVVRTTTFGAFVDLEPGLDGLVHISQISKERIAKVEDVLSVGQIVRVRVLDVNPGSKRISLSIKEAADMLDDDNMDMPMDEFPMPEIEEEQIPETVEETAEEAVEEAAGEAVEAAEEVVEAVEEAADAAEETAEE